MTERSARAGLAALVGLALLTAGCRAVGRFPGIDPSDYAYLANECSFTQVYQYRVPQVETSALEAMADLGYRDVDRREEGGEVVIRARTLDRRPARVTIRPRNRMTEMTVKVGLGDEFASDALIQRVALNFGTLPRTIIPMEPTMDHRDDPLPSRATFVVPDGPLAPEPVAAPPPPDSEPPLDPIE